MKSITLFIIACLFINTITAQTALDFNPDQGQQSVNIPDMECPSEFTFEAWIFRREQIGTFKTIFEFANDRPWFGIRNNSLAIYGVNDSSFSLAETPLNQWVHVAVTYSTSSQTVKLYLNGAMIHTESDVDLLTIGIGAGIGYNGSDNVFNGMIDELRIWEVVRTDAEIIQNLNTCYNGSESGLYAYYTFNEIDGIEVNDLSANDFDGNMVDMDPNTDYVSSDLCPLLGISTNNLGPKITVYPNPATYVLNISGLEAPTKYSIFNSIGTLIQTGNSTNGTAINTQNLAAGLYFLKLKEGTTLRFVKK